MKKSHRSYTSGLIEKQSQSSYLADNSANKVLLMLTLLLKVYMLGKRLQWWSGHLLGPPYPLLECLVPNPASLLMIQLPAGVHPGRNQVMVHIVEFLPPRGDLD